MNINMSQVEFLGGLNCRCSFRGYIIDSHTPKAVFSITTNYEMGWVGGKILPAQNRSAGGSMRSWFELLYERE